MRSLAGGPPGENLLRWDGLDGAGRRRPPASYKVRVAAERADGTAIAAEQYLAGTVEGIEPEHGVINLVVDGATVPMSAVRTVRAAAIADAAASGATINTAAGVDA